MIIVEDLVKYYGNNLAVDHLNFAANDGEILGLLGPNGAGKTTVLRCIVGIVQRSEGRIIVDGLDLATNEQDVKRRLAFVPETPSPFEMLTVEEHIKFTARAYGTIEGIEERISELLAKFELTEKKRDLVLSLSKGMKQKLAIACAFVHKANNFLFDEPLTGIDPRGARTLKDMMLRARDGGCAVLISTHMLDTAEHLCDRILILQKGVKLAEGRLDELHHRARVGEDASLEDLFLTLTEEGKAVESSSVSGV